MDVLQGRILPSGIVCSSKYIRSVRGEYVVRISSVTTFYIDDWSVFENIRHADRQTGSFAITETENQFYKLRMWLEVVPKSGVGIPETYIQIYIAYVYKHIRCEVVSTTVVCVWRFTIL